MLCFDTNCAGGRLFLPIARCDDDDGDGKPNWWNGKSINGKCVYVESSIQQECSVTFVMCLYVYRLKFMFDGV